METEAEVAAALVALRAHCKSGAKKDVARLFTAWHGDADGTLSLAELAAGTPESAVGALPRALKGGRFVLVGEALDMMSRGDRECFEAPSYDANPSRKRNCAFLSYDS